MQELASLFVRWVTSA